MRLLATLGAILFASLPALATTYLVQPDGSGDFPTIQAAVDSAAPGDTLLLESGVYSGAGNRDIDFLGKAIAVRSAAGAPDSCIVDCEGSASDPHRGFVFQSGEGPGSLLESITITNGYGSGSWPLGAAGGIQCVSASPTIRFCSITYCSSNTGGAGLYCVTYASPVLTRCKFEHCWTAGAGGAVYAKDHSSPEFAGCSFIENQSAGAGGAVYLKDFCNALFDSCEITLCTGSGGEGALRVSYSNPQVSHCTIADNFGGGLYCTYSSPDIDYTIIAYNTSGYAVGADAYSHPTLACCDLYGNPSGDYVSGAGGQYGVSGNMSKDPLFCGIYHDPDAPYRIHASSPCGPEYSGGCGLIGACEVGCTEQDFLVRPDGSGDFPTIQAAIDAALDNDHVRLADGTFTGDGNRDVSFVGKRIVVCSESGDAAACILDCQGSPGVDRRAFNFWSDEDSASVVSGLTIRNAYGSSVYCDGACPSLQRCAFEFNGGNYGGALRVKSGAAPRVNDCMFRGNYSWDRGGAVACEAGGSVSIEGCTFAGNWSYHGGAVGLTGNAQLTMSQCTLVGNYVNGYGSLGAGVWCETSTSEASVQNTIIAFSGDGAAIATNYENVALGCCDLFGNAGGDWAGAIAPQLDSNGNICEDPLFCDLEAGVYRLESESPCAPFSWPNVECDLIGAWPVGCPGSDAEEPSARRRSLRLAVLGQSPQTFHGDCARITYIAPKDILPQVKVFDSTGRLVKVLQTEDPHNDGGCCQWDGRDQSGQPVPTGVYYLRMDAVGSEATGRLVVVR